MFRGKFRLDGAISRNLMQGLWRQAGSRYVASSLGTLRRLPIRCTVSADIAPSRDTLPHLPQCRLVSQCFASIAGTLHRLSVRCAVSRDVASSLDELPRLSLRCASSGEYASSPVTLRRLAMRCVISRDLASDFCAMEWAR